MKKKYDEEESDRSLLLCVLAFANTVAFIKYGYCLRIYTCVYK